MKRYQKILLGVLAAIIIIIAGIQIYFSFYLDQQLKETTLTRFREATGNAYNLEIGDLNAKVLGRQLNLSDIKLTKKNSGDTTSIRATLDELNVSGIGVISYLFSNELSLKEIELVNPAISITTPGKSDTTGSQEQTSLDSLSRSLSGKALKSFREVSISNIRIRGLKVDYNRADLSVSPYMALENSDIHLQRIHIDSTSLTDEQVIPVEDISTTFRDLSYHTADGMYELSAGEFDFSSEDGTLEIRNLQLLPLFNKTEFAKQLQYETDRIDIGIKKLGLTGIDVSKLRQAKALIAQRIVVEKPDIDVHHDKRRPSDPNKKTPPLPQQMIRNIPFPINIDSVSLVDGNIRYSERAAEAEEPGYIEFENISATFKGLTNIEDRWSEENPPTLHAETNVMDEGRLIADYSFPMNTDNQYINGRLQQMEMAPFNETLEPLAFIRVDDGTIEGLEFKMTLTPQKATGDLSFRYEDLKISLLDKESNKETFGKKVISLLANTLKVKEDNTGEDFETAEIEFERDKTKSVFNYWWKALLSGLKSSIGL